jgi:PBSX family phage terminase large subunit
MYEIRQGKAGEADFTFYGAAREFIGYHGPEALIHGPAETGKTISALYKLHICACKYPGASIVIARKTLASCHSSVLQTFTNKVLDKGAPVTVYGGEKVEWFDYANGSRIWVAGIDKTGKVLSSEHDLIYVNQAEELTLEDWETLTTRTTGRAGNMPYSQTIGDCNPSYPLHWMYHRPALKMFYSVHQDNPRLYDPATGELTQQGQRTMAVLGNLTGTRRTRLLEGKPAQAEGVIYEDWSEAVHLIYADKVPPLVRFVAGQDWGFTHPGSLGLWGLDGDGRMYLVAQYYMTLQTIDWWVERAKALKAEFTRYDPEALKRDEKKIVCTVEVYACDPSEPSFIEAYRRAGLNAIAANNDVRPGIDAVQQRLKSAGDGKPRLYVVRDSLREPDQGLIEARRPYAVEHEFPAYVWANTKAKEGPVKENDHGMDMTRYTVRYLDIPIRFDGKVTVQKKNPLYG